MRGFYLSLSFSISYSPFFLLIMNSGMETSPNSMDSWPSDEDQVEPMALVAVWALVEVLPSIEAPIAPSKFGDIEPKEFLSGEVSFVLSKRALEHLRTKFHIPLQFILEVHLSFKWVCGPPPGQLALYKES